MKLHVYKVEKVDDYVNTASTIDYDYEQDFNKLKKLRGYVKIDYYVTDTPDINNGEVFFIGNGSGIIKVLEKVTEFDNDPIGLKFEGRK